MNYNQSQLNAISYAKTSQARKELERNIEKLFGVDLFNAIYYFDDCKTRRGTFNRLAKMNKLQFDGKVATTKRTCLLLIETLDAIRERDKTFKETQYRTLKVHYSVFCNYVSSLLLGPRPVGYHRRGNELQTAAKGRHVRF